jgi:RNA polymerase sigma factor (sigma-70 family)
MANTTEISKEYFEIWRNNPTELNRVLFISTTAGYIYRTASNVIRQNFPYLDESGKDDLISGSLANVWESSGSLRVNFHYKEALGYISKIVSTRIFRVFNKNNMQKRKGINVSDKYLRKTPIYVSNQIANFFDLLDDIRELDESQKELLTLRYLYGYTFKQIAVIKGVSRQWVNKQISIILKGITNKKELYVR